MAIYTTQVRTICESLAGYDEPQGLDTVNEVIEKARVKIFDNYELFDEAYKPVLERKILKHYYMREIGSETYGLWKLRFNEKMEEILPYYNQLYKSNLLSFNPFYDVDYTVTKDVEGGAQDVTTAETESTKEDNTLRTTTDNNTRTTDINTTNETEGTTGTNNLSEGTATRTQWDLFSNTPQGGISKMETEENMFLTTATKVSDSNSTTDETTQTATHSSTADYNELGTTTDLGTGTADIKTTATTEALQTTNKNLTTTEDYLEKVQGKRGFQTYSKLLKEYRETFINIDKALINEFADMFMNLWN